MEKIRTKIIFFTTFFLGMLFCLPAFTFAASMGFSPASGNTSVNSYVTVNVYVVSTDQAMNGVSGLVSFPNNLLSVSSISQSGSIIGIWAQQPTFSNTNGTINFEGVAVSPGFTGAYGKIISIVFKAKAPGIADIKFTSGSILANDGNGTDITKGLGTSQFTISPASLQAVPATPNATTTSALPLPPTITYSKNTINEGDAIVIKGTSAYPDANITVSLQYENQNLQNYSILTDKNGAFTFAYTSGAELGTYKIWAQVTNSLGQQSPNSLAYTISVLSPYWILIGPYEINIFVLLGILLALILLIAYLLRRSYRNQKEFSDMIMHADKLATVKFKYFSEYVNAQIDDLEKDAKVDFIPGFKKLIEDLKKRITDYKSFIDTDKK